MSRTNGSQPQPGVRGAPAGGSGADQDPRTWGTHGGTQHGQAAAAGSGRPAQPQAASHFQPAAYPAPPGGGLAGDPYGQGQGFGLSHGQGHYPGAGQPAGGYSGHYDAAAYGQPQGAPQQQQYFPQANAGYGGQPAGQGQREPAHALRGSSYEHQWQAQAPQQDARGFDLSSYQTAGSYPQAQPYAPQGGYQHSQTVQHADWQAHDGFAQGVQPSLEAQAYAGGHQDAAGEQGFADEEGYEYEEEPKSRRWMTIGAVLGLAIAVGGTGMYAYDKLFGAPQSNAPPPVVKNDAGAAKVKPADPGGMKFEHADTKIMGRLGEGGAGAEAGSEGTDANGSRKVATLVVNPDGSIQPPPAKVEAEGGGEGGDTAGAVGAGQGAGREAAAGAGVPGLSIVDVSGGQKSQSGMAQQGAAAGAPPAKAVKDPVEPQKAQQVQQAKQAEAGSADKAASEKPVIISKPQQAAQAAADDAASGAAQPPKKAAAPAAEKKVAAAAPQAQQQAATAGTKTTGAGYVAVLASVPASGSSQLDALKQFADLKLKYANLLGDKTPEVQVANLGEKGTYHRLLVGPPGSQESVKELCSNLKAAGYSGCWPLAY